MSHRGHTCDSVIDKGPELDGVIEVMNMSHRGHTCDSVIDKGPEHVMGS